MALIEGPEGSGKPLLHTSGSSVIADNARDDYASNQIFEDDGLCPTSSAKCRKSPTCWLTYASSMLGGTIATDPMKCISP